MTKVIQNRESESAMTLPLVNLEDFERDRREFLLIYTITKAAVTHITRTMAISSNKIQRRIKVIAGYVNRTLSLRDGIINEFECFLSVHREDYMVTVRNFSETLSRLASMHRSPQNSTFCQQVLFIGLVFFPDQYRYPSCHE